MWNLTNEGLKTATSILGANLEVFKIKTEPITLRYLNNTFLSALSEDCPNLRVFYVMSDSYYYERAGVQDSLTNLGLNLLLSRCKSLETLELHHCKNITLKFFSQLVEKLEKGELPALKRLAVSNIPALASRALGADADDAIELKEKLGELLEVKHGGSFVSNKCF